jgi:hypothetical protein
MDCYLLPCCLVLKLRVVVPAAPHNPDLVGLSRLVFSSALTSTETDLPSWRPPEGCMSVGEVHWDRTLAEASGACHMLLVGGMAGRIQKGSGMLDRTLLVVDGSAATLEN